MDEVVLAGVARTPFGRLGGSLSALSAIDLGSVVIRASLERAGVPFDQVDGVILGTVITAGLGQIPARQAALKAGLSKEVSALTVNKVCASSLKAINLAAQAIKAGDAQVVVAGGMESMSGAPYLVDGARFGLKMGDATFVDSIMRDGLNCPVGCVPMHEYGSDVAAEFEISREDQDRWALSSQQRWAQALESGKFDEEVVPVEVPGRNGDLQLVSVDEAPRPDTTLEALARLRPLKSGGSVTAGNAPSVNDGASALVVLSRSKAEELGVRPLAIHLAQGEANDENRYLHTVPADAICNGLKKANLRLPDVGLFEINEAFAAVTLKSTQMLGIDPEIVNVDGGAVAMGHPIGASGARILGHLVLEMQRRGVEYGAAGICSGMAQGEAAIVRLAR
ncbi:MAG TPA: acetyl-CoA C-acyltransferase [Chloroflexi bacterium]|jgi:acetyl-CoA C-acetyltransferase|nr:acetyl-CoA C-acyltransferase [Chloroflexota bacterium]